MTIPYLCCEPLENHHFATL